jgi:hypothetical protein
VNRRILKKCQQGRRRFAVKIFDIAIERHRQNCIDLPSGRDRRLRGEQIRALRHAHHHAQLRVRHAALQFAEEFLDPQPNAGHVLRMQIAVTGHADDER